MYDILQLNDLLLPVLQDIAQGLKITGFKKLDKQALIYKILDSQAVSEASAKDDGKKKPALKGRKPVTVKTSNGTEEAEVMSEEPAAAPAQKGRPIKKANQRPERPERPEKAEAPAAVAAAVPENADTAQAPENAEAAPVAEATTEVAAEVAAPVAEEAKAAGGEPIWDVVAKYLRDIKTVKAKQLNMPIIEGAKGNPGFAA